MAASLVRFRRNFLALTLTVSGASVVASHGRAFSLGSLPPEPIEYEVLGGHRYRVFERQRSGEPLSRVSTQDMLADLTDDQRRLVLFGEEHGHPLCHRLERDLYATWLRTRRAGDSVSISLEMLSTERRSAVNAYLGEEVRTTFANSDLQDDNAQEEERVFGGEWANFFDYAPLIKLARIHGQGVVAANAPRRLTSIVARGGESALLAHLAGAGGDRDLISPLPLRKPSPELCRSIGPIFETFRGKRDPDRRDRMLLAQTLWDSTMAFSIARRLLGEDVATPESAVPRRRKLLHCCGRLHVQGFQGILDHLSHYVDTAEGEKKLFSSSRLSALDESDEPAFSMSNRDQTRLVVVIVSDELAERKDEDVASDPALADAADFVVVVGTP